MIDAAALLGSSVREQVERFISTLDAIDQGLQILGPDLRYLYVNAACARQGRQQREAVLGRLLTEVHPGIEGTPFYKQLKEVLITRRATVFENEYAYPDGTSGWFEVRAEPHENGLIIFTVDITERKRLEARVLHTQKLDVVGQLASGVAHDFNNLLSVILIGVRLVLDDLPAASPHRPDLEDVYAAGERAAALTRQLLAFSRSNVAQLRLLELRDLVGRTERMLHTVVGERVRVVLAPGDTPLVVRADRNLLEQVLLNLVINARDAMPDGGTIHLALEARGDEACLVVTDTGVGMSEATRARVFEPFFTTKERGKGTGLGLSTVLDIVHRLDGRVDVRSAPGKGSTFTVHLPLQRDAAPESTPPAPRPRQALQTGLVLVVDDERAVATAVAGVLERAGYGVRLASSAEEALTLAAALPELALLLTDVVLPGMNGRALSDTLRAQRPSLPVLFMSGYADDALLTERLAEPHTGWLEKPVVPERLLVQLEKLLPPAR